MELPTAVAIPGRRGAGQVIRRKPASWKDVLEISESHNAREATMERMRVEQKREQKDRGARAGRSGHGTGGG
ncbi:hypothetical protein K505DRAFT_96257 [Melanomma pulvis-pyrius CBS 109.77]|uniref:Uncharacterized protein n=1 Tax=Melanomma pulvis-pyrius CBS 109.77 TaxID=1314802 RepID=A0A6A6WYX4_9PLEO|nr:hypothetical protein K505DRAFT_96257 [Melanomma pulvis-pyrius CBS 109.77]